MKLGFVNTVLVPNADGTLTREHPDSDSTPSVSVYKGSSDELIESPTPTKDTSEYATGCYTFPLTAVLYEEQTMYYFIATSVFTVGGTQFTNVSDKNLFQWGWRGDVTSDAAKGYNYNLFKVIKATLVANSTLMDMLGHTDSVNKITREANFRATKRTKPVLTIKITDQRKNDRVGMNVSKLRQSVVDFVFWDTKKGALEELVQMTDLLNEYLNDTNDHRGIRFDSDDGTFKTGRVEWQMGLSTPEEPGVDGYEEDYELYSCGARYIVEAALLD